MYFTRAKKKEKGYNVGRLKPQAPADSFVFS